MSSPFLRYITEQMRVKRYAKRTIQSYLYWIKAYINFNDQRHPINCHDVEVELFLSYLTNTLNVAPKTQGLALNALVFLYRVILSKPLTLELNFNKSKQATKLPVVLTQAEVSALLSQIANRYALPCKLMYGSGLRLMEVVRLRVQDIDFDFNAIQIWQGKGGKEMIDVSMIMDEFSEDIARGNGEALTAVAVSLGVTEADRALFKATMHNNFDSIFPSENVTTEHVVSTMFTLMKNDKELVKYTV
jgi:site-specific recombinase XerD